jgi:hypothetical protein
MIKINFHLRNLISNRVFMAAETLGKKGDGPKEVSGL